MPSDSVAESISLVRYACNSMDSQCKPAVHETMSARFFDSPNDAGSGLVGHLAFRVTADTGSGLTRSEGSDNRLSIYRNSFMPRRKLDPLPSAAFNILLALAGEDLHGYAIMRQVEQQTRGRVRLGPGTLYGSLQTLLEASLIEEIADASRQLFEDSSGAQEGKDRRRYYRLTPAGLKVVRAEVESLAQMLRIARAKRILRGADV